jgi:hypothetical protein
MPTSSTAHLTRVIQFPDELGQPIWRERRTFPLVTVLGAPLAFLAVGAIAVRPLALHLVLAAATMAALWLLYRARARAVLETYTITDRFVAIEQARGGRVGLPTERLTGVTLVGDKVRLDSRDGVVTLAFVRRQRGLLRALERAAPGVHVEDDDGRLVPDVNAAVLGAPCARPSSGDMQPADGAASH